MKKPKLIPPDKERCQTLKSNGHGPFTLGGVPGMVRCSNKPIVIAKEVKPNKKDKLRGSMSLCEGCLKTMKEQLGEGHCTFKEIKR